VPLDPFLEPVLANYPETPRVIEDFPAFRAENRVQSEVLVSQLAEPGPEVGDRRRVTVPVDGGEIDLLVYRPSGPGPHPAHLYLHGGGWVVGSVDHAHIDITCRERCVGAQCVVVSVDYRKAPEHKFPIPLEDCYTALTWVVDNAAELGIDADRITVGGGSAGGNLAAALALKARDEGGPRIAFQLLEVPALDLTLALPAHQQYGAGYALSTWDMEFARQSYLTSLAEAAHPYASPLLAPDLTGLPPAHVMSAEFDVLADDGAEYVRRLAEAGVPATFSLQEGHVHVSSAMTAVMESARAWREEVLSVLRGAHAGQGA
jgi:acetyl esterase